MQLARDARYHHSATVEEEGLADVVILASRLASSGLPVTLRTAVGAPLASLKILVCMAATAPSAAVIALTAQGLVRLYQAIGLPVFDTRPSPATLQPCTGWPAGRMSKRQHRRGAVRVLQAGDLGFRRSST